jgi:hypothetical protein
MKRSIVALVFALGCNSSSAVDAGPDAGGPAQCDGGCATALADYCQANPAACPADPAQAVADLCAGAAVSTIKVYGGCGYTIVIGSGVDTSSEEVFDADGGLVAIYRSSPVLGTCCTAGPSGFDVPGLQGCTLALPSCDAGIADASSE